MNREVFLAAACRTPVGRFQGALKSLRAPELGAIVVRETLRRCGVAPEAVEECILGNAIGAGLGQNPARQAAIAAGIPVCVPSFTVNKVCGSGLKAVMLAAQAIQAGDAEIIVAGGMESMTNAPYLLPTGRSGARLGHAKILDAMVHDGLWDVTNDFHMGNTAELVAKKYNISRTEQDAFAVESHRRASQAQAQGRFEEEIVPVRLPGKDGSETVVRQDEGPRADSSPEKLRQLPPAFEATGQAGVPAGTVTAGNASQLSDGASALLVVSEAKVRELGLKPLARVTGYAAGGTAPEWVMMAPLDAVGNYQKRYGKGIQDFDLVEINEAFAVSCVALAREFQLDPKKLNVHGGAVALGHPIGCTGARILTTLVYALKQRKLKTGLATLCLGGGNALALSVEIV